MTLSMPSPRDITGDLSRLPRRRLKVKPARPPAPRRQALRAMAFDPVLWVTGLGLIAALASQLALVIWMW